MTAQMRERAHKLLNGLAPEFLPDVIKTLESYCRQSASTEPVAAETELIEIINRRLAASDRERFETLQDKNEWGTLTAAEQQELLNYVETIEDMDVERVEAMMKLAQLRQVSLNEVLVEFAPKRLQDEEE